MFSFGTISGSGAAGGAPTVAHANANQSTARECSFVVVSLAPYRAGLNSTLSPFSPLSPFSHFSLYSTSHFIQLAVLILILLG